MKELKFTNYLEREFLYKDSILINKTKQNNKKQTNKNRNRDLANYFRTIALFI